jgi:hypothetical protein
MTLLRRVELRRWIESRRLSARGAAGGSRRLKQEGPSQCRWVGRPKLVPPSPANGVDLGSPAVSATAAPPFPWETACEPTPTPFTPPTREGRQGPAGRVPDA